MQCTQRLDPVLLDELLVETRTIDELDLDQARVAPILKIEFRAKPPQRLDVTDIEVIAAAVVSDRPQRALSAAPGGTVSHVVRNWWIAGGAIVAGVLGVAIWLVF